LNRYILKNIKNKSFTCICWNCAFITN